MCWTHVVEDAFGILTVMSTLHDGEKQLRSVVLELQYEVHPLLTEWVDVVEDESDDNVDSVAIVTGDRVLNTTTTT